VILTRPEEYETWLTAPADEAFRLQWPLPNAMLKDVTEGSRSDPAEQGDRAKSQSA
jgi:putative SOS response-associated peptidase YedK